MKIYLILEKSVNEAFDWVGYSSNQNKYLLYKDFEYAERMLKLKTIEVFKDLVKDKEYGILNHDVISRNAVEKFIDKHSELMDNIDDESCNILDVVAKNDDLIIEYLVITGISFYHIVQAEFDDILA